MSFFSLHSVFANNAGRVCLQIANLDSFSSTQEQALRCQNVVQSAYYFDENAVSVCSDLITDTFTSTQKKAIECLEAIKNKSYDSFSVQLCSQIANQDSFTSTKTRAVECLANSGTDTIVTPDPVCSIDSYSVRRDLRKAMSNLDRGNTREVRRILSRLINLL